MKKLLVLSFLVVVAGLVAWLAVRPKPPREVAFARVTREKLVSTLVTNARLEPLEFSSVRAAREGSLVGLQVEAGQRIAIGHRIAEIDARDTEAEIVASQSRIAQAAADLKLFEQGGATAALAEIESARSRAQLDLGIARNEAATLERLVARNAATRRELASVQERIRQLETDLAALERKQTSLLPPGGREAAEARLREARSSLQAAQQRLEQATIRSPIAGIVYSLPVKPGGYVRPGDEIAQVGRTDVLKAIVYVDEPELGRVSRGLLVRFTWDAMPGRQWQARLEKLPTQIVSLGTRQVGEVICRLDNRDGVLPPGANVNAEVESRVVEKALTIPKAALRREGQQAGVLLLVGTRVEWRPVETGVSSVTRVEVRQGLQEGDAVALPTETPLRPGEQVRPQLP